MKFWAVGGREVRDREVRDRMLSLEGLPHLISPICCDDPGCKVTAVSGEHFRSCKNTPYQVWVLAIHQQWGAHHSFNTVPFSRCHLLCEASENEGPRRLVTGEGEQVRLRAASLPGAGSGLGPALGGAAVRSGACQAAFGSWLTFLCTCGHCSSPAGVFGSGVSCTHVVSEWKISLLLSVLNRTLSSSLKGSKGTDKRAFKSVPPVLEIQMQLS